MTHHFETICVVGLGYIGLPTAALIASKGLRVVGVDINPKAVAAVNEGKPHIIEPDLEGLLHKVVTDGDLKATDTPAKADAFIITVPTPLITATKKPDTSYVMAAIESIAPHLEKGNLVIIESTCPPGTTNRVAETLSTLRADLTFPNTTATPDVHLSYCPERVLPGRILTELTENDRAIGGMSDRCREKTIALYQIFSKGQLLPTNAGTAEMVKLVENAYRDVNIAFANELSIICDALGHDVWEIIRHANRHPRVSILQPGAGVGGHCIAIDPWFIVDAAPDQADLIKEARIINDKKPAFIIQKVQDRADTLKHPKIACLGLAFKPNVDDLRESPALEITTCLVDQGFDVVVAEPFIEKMPENLKNVPLLPAQEAVAQADIILCLTRHTTFSTLNLAQYGEKVIDVCGILQDTPLSKMKTA